MTLSWKSRVNRRRQMPGLVRPARPLRCFAEAQLIHFSVSADMPRFGSWSTRRCKPKSITATTLGRVTEDSAMSVESTMFVVRGSGSWKTISCSSLGIMECNGYTLYLLLSSNALASSQSEEISEMPGKKTKIVVPGSAMARTRSVTMDAIFSQCRWSMRLILSSAKASFILWSMSCLQLILLPNSLWKSSRYNSFTGKHRPPT
mmetsp:Transcript_9366/g.33168  ORF Transcript_9366/g.33168 Transcript_9366/m.33168 type:complete len:204 (-) Transcript_9366:163-774(-)